MRKSKKLFILLFALFLTVNCGIAADDNVTPDKTNFLEKLSKKWKTTPDEARKEVNDEVERVKKKDVDKEIQQDKQNAQKYLSGEEKPAVEETKTGETKESNEKSVVEETRADVFDTTNDIILKEENKNSEAVNPYTNDVHSVFTVEDCIKIAIDYNPQIRSSVYNAQAYKTKIVQAWANYFPSLNLGLNAKNMGYHFTGSQDTSINNNMAVLPTVSADMLLFDFGKTKATADMAKKNYEAKTSDTMETINVLFCNIKTVYYNTLFAQVQVEVYQDTVKDYELQLDRAVSFYKAGKKAKIDVITAEYNLGKAKLNLVKAENTLAVSRVQLAKVMGIPEYTNFELSTKLGTDKYAVSQEDAINKAYEVRPELISALKTMEAAKLDLRAKRRAYAPDIALNAGYDNNIGSSIGYYGYQVGVGLKYNQFNFLKVKKQVDEADAVYKKKMADYEDAKHNLYLNVKKAYLDLKTAEDAIIIAKLALDEAKEQYRQSSGRYKAGVADFIELKDGETTYLNARLEFYNSLLSYNTAAANLEKEIGAPLTTTNEKVLAEEFIE